MFVEVANAITRSAPVRAGLQHSQVVGWHSSSPGQQYMIVRVREDRAQVGETSSDLHLCTSQIANGDLGSPIARPGILLGERGSWFGFIVTVVRLLGMLSFSLQSCPGRFPAASAANRMQQSSKSLRLVQ